MNTFLPTKSMVLFLLLNIVILPVSVVYAKTYPTQACPTPNLRHAERLGWVNTPCSGGLCNGYYQEPLLNYEQRLAANDMQIIAGASSLFRSGRSELMEGVLIERPFGQLESDTAYIYRPSTGQQFNRVELFGNIRLREQGRLILGNDAYFDLTNNSGEINQAFYRYAYSDDYQIEADIAKNYGLNAWGQAAKLRRFENGDYELFDTSLTTCPPLTSDWKMTAANVYLDQAEGRGYAKNVVIRVRDYPIFYLPYFSFPIDDRRKSGFLTPQIGYTRHVGVEFAVPFYWNIAPNVDATITPKYLGRRGVMTQGEFRYLQQQTQGGLTARSEGEIYFSYLPRDRAWQQFKRDNDIDGISNHRGSLTLNHQSVFDNNWRWSVNYNQVSDDYYLQDFSTSINELTQNQLVRQGLVEYTGENWTFSTLFQGYQTLRPHNYGAGSYQYSRLPRITLNANYPNFGPNLEVSMNSQFDYFVWPAKNDEGIKDRLQGSRLFLNPIVSAPFRQDYGFIIPSVQVHHTEYRLFGDFEKPATEYLAKNVTRSVPIISLDSGLLFERFTDFLKKDYIQTLEPRMFYLYVPYTEQRQINIFDASYYTFNYDQLFRVNRFSGYDRIGDSNHLALALTSRLMDGETGEEKLRMSIGQIIYFQDRQVSLCKATRANPHCDDEHGINEDRYNQDKLLKLRSGFYSAKANLSPIAGQVVYSVWPGLKIVGNLVYDPFLKRWNNGNVNLEFRLPGDDPLVFDLNYNYITNGDTAYEQGKTPARAFDERKPRMTKKIDLSQIGGSFGLPLSKNWRTLGSMRYNLNTAEISSAYLGVEYESCCWAIRLFGGRVITSLDEYKEPVYNRSIFLQFSFKGLGSVASSDPSDVIKKNILGYQDIFRQGY